MHEIDLHFLDFEYIFGLVTDCHLDINFPASYQKQELWLWKHFQLEMNSFD